MSDSQAKPLNWTGDSTVGYSVERRADGGMNYEFSDVSRRTLEHWREFALDHLLDSDRLTRNLYDLRQINSIPREAVEYGTPSRKSPRWPIPEGWRSGYLPISKKLKPG
jgi:hypothetical protein